MSLLWLSATSVAFHTIPINKWWSPFPCPLEYICHQLTSPPGHASTLKQTACLASCSLSTGDFTTTQALPHESPEEDREPFGKKQTKAIILFSSTHTSSRPSGCARTGPPPAPNARAHGTQRRGWWSQLEHRTGGRRWRRCWWSRAASPTGTACRGSPDMFKSLPCKLIY